MKRSTRNTLAAATLVVAFGVGYAAGAILYMVAVASHFRGVENGKY
jgi:hypothetical protein